MIENLNLKLSGKEPINREELIILISSWGRKASFETFDNLYINKCEPNECYDLSNLDVSQITDMSYVFRYSMYNGDLSKWDVSNVKTLESMFSRSYFDGNISTWNVSNVEIMLYCFYKSQFNGDISNWNVSNCDNFDSLFEESQFNGDISSWQFNEESNCFDLFTNNQNFINKYNNGESIPRNTKTFTTWFENNKEKIKEINYGTTKEILDFFSFQNEKILTLK